MNEGMRYKLIILDFDGTLGDTRSIILKTMQQTIAHLGLEKRTDEDRTGETHG